MAEPLGPARWLVLVHQLPPKPSNLRVRIWRRLQEVGAVVLRNSVYVLPNTAEGVEDFTWIRGEIAAARGQASVLEATAVDGYTDEDLIKQFRAASSERFAALASEARRMATRLRKPRTRTRRAALLRELKLMRERLARVEATDYFGAANRQDARSAFEALEGMTRSPSAPALVVALLKPTDYRRLRWMTRPRPGIDRMSSAWLIRQFVDRDAAFGFVTDRQTLGATDIPFDMPDVEFGHHGPDCTFETLMRRFGIQDRAVGIIARVVHDLDLKETRYGVPETAAIGRIVDGLRLAYPDDAALLEQGIVVIDALYRSFAEKNSNPIGGRQNMRRRTGGRAKLAS